MANNFDLTTIRGKLSVAAIGAAVLGVSASTATLIYLMTKMVNDPDVDPDTVGKLTAGAITGYLASFATCSIGLFCSKKTPSNSQSSDVCNHIVIPRLTDSN